MGVPLPREETPGEEQTEAERDGAGQLGSESPVGLGPGSEAGNPPEWRIRLCRHAFQSHSWINTFPSEYRERGPEKRGRALRAEREGGEKAEEKPAALSQRPREENAAGERMCPPG